MFKENDIVFLRYPEGQTATANLTPYIVKGRWNTSEGVRYTLHHDEGLEYEECDLLPSSKFKQLIKETINKAVVDVKKELKQN